MLEWDFAVSLRPSAGMRNVRVHDYLEIDHGMVSAAVPLAGYERCSQPLG
ncbi:MAG: HepT-like ribonuclease domain-containing protein [Pseudonocardiaceae bacterium]